MTQERVPYQLTPPTAGQAKSLRQAVKEYVEGFSFAEHFAEAIEGFLATTKLAPALDGEPVFVLRAQDKTAPLVVFMWAEEASQRGCAAKADGARQIASEMIAWQQANPTRVKNPD